MMLWLLLILSLSLYHYIEQRPFRSEPPGRRESAKASCSASRKSSTINFLNHFYEDFFTKNAYLSSHWVAASKFFWEIHYSCANLSCTVQPSSLRAIITRLKRKSRIPPSHGGQNKILSKAQSEMVIQYICDQAETELGVTK